MGRLTVLMLILGCGLHAGFARADGKRDNNPAVVRQVPPKGVMLSAADAEELGTQLAGFREDLAKLREAKNPQITTLLPDVEIFYKAVADAVQYNELFKPNDIRTAKQNLQTGRQRAYQLSIGKSPWTTQTGLTVRGYVSKLDGSVQPYGLIIPESYRFDGDHKHRLDIWFHGRGETLSENNFLQQRQSQKGYYAPAETIVLHPYGRYSNAFKFAGEVDVLEALATTKQQYRVDEDRVSVRGFSMGGAACWQFAVHYPTDWFAANPGAGFAETPEFLKSFQQQQLNPTWWEQRLWRWYDCTDWSRNLAHCPTIAYSGENDIQKQAADIMAASLADHGMRLQHIIGPKMGHKIDPVSAGLIETRMADLAKPGREVTPREVHLTTYTLRYPTSSWVTVTGLQEHWQRSTIDARIETNRIVVETSGVTGIDLNFPAGTAPRTMKVAQRGPGTGNGLTPLTVTIDHRSFKIPPVSDRSLHVSFVRDSTGKWALGEFPTNVLRKRPGLQGPIDDALLDSFVFVSPSDPAANVLPGKWAAAEQTRAQTEWRRHFRGVARVKADVDVTADDVANSNLILWGDPSSNVILKNIAARLPIRWTKDNITVGDKTYPAETHALIAVYPNPLNPSKYVVLNSSFTYREFAYLNNARQVPMLPDWAVVDLRTPPDSVWPGKVVSAGFFDENWQLQPHTVPAGE